MRFPSSQKKSTEPNGTHNKNQFKVTPIMKDHQIRNLTNHPVCGHANKQFSAHINPTKIVGNIPTFCSTHSIALVDDQCTICIESQSPKETPVHCKLHSIELVENRCIICVKDQPVTSYENTNTKEEVCIIDMTSSKILIAEASIGQNIKSKMWPRRWLDATCFTLASVAILFFIYNEVTSAMAFNQSDSS